jgi:hypothetical protein
MPDDRVLDEDPHINEVLKDVRRCLHQGLDRPKQFGRVMLEVGIQDSSVKHWEPVFIPMYNQRDLTRRRTAG